MPQRRTLVVMRTVLYMAAVVILALGCTSLSCTNLEDMVGNSGHKSATGGVPPLSD